MDHVRHHLDGDLRLAALADVANFSPHHFHRVFKATMRETLTSFVQRARLERAATLMKTVPSRKLDSIALEVGFSAHSDFSRVFKKRYGIAPRDWDRRSRLDDIPIADDYAEMLAAARRNSPPLTAVVVTQPERRLLTVRTNTPFVGPDLEAGYSALTTHLDQVGVDWRAETLVGFSWDNYETTPIEQVHFDFGFTVPDYIGDHDAFRVQTVRAHRAVQIHCVGELVTIALAWEELFDRWLPSSHWEPDELPGFKVFRVRPDELGWKRYDLDCSLAIRALSP